MMTFFPRTLILETKIKKSGPSVSQILKKSRNVLQAGKRLRTTGIVDELFDFFSTRHDLKHLSPFVLFEPM